MLHYPAEYRKTERCLFGFGQYILESSRGSTFSSCTLHFRLKVFFFGSAVLMLAHSIHLIMLHSVLMIIISLKLILNNYLNNYITLYKILGENII